MKLLILISSCSFFHRCWASTTHWIPKHLPHHAVFLRTWSPSPSSTMWVALQKLSSFQTWSSSPASAAKLRGFKPRQETWDEAARSTTRTRVEFKWAAYIFSSLSTNTFLLKPSPKVSQVKKKKKKRADHHSAHDHRQHLSKLIRHHFINNALKPIRPLVDPQHRLFTSVFLIFVFFCLFFFKYSSILKSLYLTWLLVIKACFHRKRNRTIIFLAMTNAFSRTRNGWNQEQTENAD